MNKELFIATTDTILGLGAPISKLNFRTIYKIKKRPKNKKLVIMISDLDQLKNLISFDSEFVKFTKKYWPGATTIIYKNQGFRMPNNKKLLNLIKRLGPIYMTSANISGQKPLSLKQAKVIFKEINQFYDFGKGSNKSSTIIEYETGKIFRK